MHPTQTFDLCLRDHAQRLTDHQLARTRARASAERSRHHGDARAHPPEVPRIALPVTLPAISGAAR